MIAPSWITTENISQKSPDTLSGQISLKRIRCPVELIGSHSVIPSTIPRSIDLMISNISIIISDLPQCEVAEIIL